MCICPLALDFIQYAHTTSIKGYKVMHRRQLDNPEKFYYTSLHYLSGVRHQLCTDNADFTCPPVPADAPPIYSDYSEHPYPAGYHIFLDWKDALTEWYSALRTSSFPPLAIIQVEGFNPKAFGTQPSSLAAVIVCEYFDIVADLTGVAYRELDLKERAKP